MERAMFGLIVLLFSLAATANQPDWPKADNPMKYAQEQSKFFAEGDSNDSSGWQGCAEAFTEANEITRIQCTGQRDLLVHGGHWARSPFACEFSFEPSPDWVGYIVTHEKCE